MASIKNTFLLCTERNGVEYVSEYMPSEMEEVFTASERDTLARKGIVRRPGVTMVDMLKAARERLAD